MILETVRNIIQQLDLSQIKRKLTLPEPEGKGWTTQQADVAERWYRRFLIALAERPDLSCVPNAPIDAFWHYHILDTRKYIEDCQAIFGEYVHHYPYFGLNGDTAARDAAFDATCAFYLEQFGEDCRKVPEFSVDQHGVSCNDGGSGTGCGQGCSRGSRSESPLEEVRA